MHIGIDASRAAAPQRTGTENYSLHLLRSLLALRKAQEHRFTLYFNRPPAAHLFPYTPHFQKKVMPFPRLWTHLRLSLEMIQHAPDVLFVPAHVLPLIHPRRSVVTIHDLGYLYYPSTHRPWAWHYLYLTTAYNARYARHIIVDSGATKADVVTRLKIDPNKITVVYPAASPEFRPNVDKEAIKILKDRYGVEGDYILYVGTLHPRKNLARLIAAYSKLRRESQVQARLVLAGVKGWLPSSLLRELDRLDTAITLTGFVSPEDLPILYSGAALLVMPSLFEGFGLPVLEAMACGTPVVAAYGSALPEVVADAGILVDPLSVDDIAGGIAQVINNPSLRAELRGRGLLRARSFSWHEAAQKTLAVLETQGQEKNKK
ncbi:MAG: glycosyltransferase family 4 protein [Chloroflexi bacterium]|nr:glycosyltransferase family 4 protein [Chloroflexota bacterium]